MNRRLFSYQIFWKEYRQMRGFWLGVLLLTLMMQVMLYFLASDSDLSVLFGIAVSFSALYALGCGATMFALEHENGTYDYLRALPTRPLPTFFSKVAFTLVSAPLLAIATGAVATSLAFHRHTFRIEDLAMILGWALASAFLFVWAALCSLLMRHAVKAALLGGCAAAFSLIPIEWLVDHLPRGWSQDAGWIACAAVIVLLSIVDFWLGTRWYREPSTARTATRRRSREAATQTDAHALQAMPSRADKFGHLVWLQWRQSQGMLLILSAIFAAGILGMVWHESLRELFRPRTHSGVLDLRWLHDLTSIMAMLAIWAGVAVVPLAGANVFAGDQKQYQFRFLADRGLSPRSIWWSRHAVWAPAVLVWTMIASICFVVVAFRLNALTPAGIHPTMWMNAVVSAFTIPMAYCFGQFCSMLSRSGILCGTMAIAGALFSAAWVLMMIVLGVPLYWSVLPVPVIFLVGSRIRTRPWLFEDNSLKRWLPTLAVVALPIAAILSGVCLYRAYSVPAVAPGFDVAEFITGPSPEATKTAEMYRTAIELAGRGKGKEIDPLLEAVPLAIEASQRSRCADLGAASPKFAESLNQLAGLIRSEAGAIQDPDSALQQHLALLQMAEHLYQSPALIAIAQRIEESALEGLAEWAGRKGQTKERILPALRELQRVTRQSAPFDNMIKNYYVDRKKVIEGNVHAMYDLLGPSSPEAHTAAVIYWMPWERERARRVLRLITSSELDTYRQIRAGLDYGRPVPEHILTAAVEKQEPERTRSWLPQAPDAWLRRRDVNQEIGMLVETELKRRAARIQLALAAWQAEHGSLPEKLDDLKDGYLAEVPLDPYSGEPFLYAPTGRREPLVKIREFSGMVEVVVEADKPYLWSPGPEVLVHQKGHIGPGPKYSMWTGSEWSPVGVSMERVWAAGCVFPVPQPR